MNEPVSYRCAKCGGVRFVVEYHHAVPKGLFRRARTERLDVECVACGYRMATAPGTLRIREFGRIDMPTTGGA